MLSAFPACRTVLQDLRCGLRTLARSPGLAVAAVLSLALGIGVNSAMFGIVNALLLRPIPVVKEPDRLLAVYQSPTTGPVFLSSLSYADYADLRNWNEVFSVLATYSTPRPFSHLWKRRFGSDPGVVGRTIRLNGAQFTARLRRNKRKGLSA